MPACQSSSQTDDSHKWLLFNCLPIYDYENYFSADKHRRHAESFATFARAFTSAGDYLSELNAGWQWVKREGKEEEERNKKRERKNKWNKIKIYKKENCSSTGFYVCLHLSRHTFIYLYKCIQTHTHVSRTHTHIYVYVSI